MTSDIRHAFRAIGRMPMVSSVIILSLAAGIGVNTVVFSWVQSRVFRPLPGVRDSGSFLGIEARTDSGTYPGSSWQEYRDLSERLRGFDRIVAARMIPTYVGETGTVERVYGLLVSDNYFDALEVIPAAGRFPSAAEMAGSTASPMAVIGYGLWMSRYGGATGAIGRTIRVNGVDAPIAAVTPEVFQGTVSASTSKSTCPREWPRSSRADRASSTTGRCAATRCSASSAPACRVRRRSRRPRRRWPP